MLTTLRLFWRGWRKLCRHVRNPITRSAVQYLAPITAVAVASVAALHRLAAAATWREGPTALVDTVAMSAVLLAVLVVLGHERERRRKADAKNAAVVLHSHKSAAAAVAVATTFVGGLPSQWTGLLPSVWWRAGVTIAVVTVGWRWAWRIAARQPGAEPTWRAAARAGWSRHRHVWGLTVTAVAAGGAVAVSTAHLPGGDSGASAATLALIMTSWPLGKKIAADSSRWWRTVTAACGADNVAWVRVTPDWAHLEDDWGCTTKLRLGTTDSKVRSLGANLTDSLNPERWSVRAGRGTLIVKATAPMPLVAPMPATVLADDPDELWRLPIGVTRAGGGNVDYHRLTEVNDPKRKEVVRCDEVLLLSEEIPHTLMVGTTGSGKTVAITVLASQALLRGWQLVVCEAVKSTLDYRPLAPWCSGLASRKGQSLTGLTEIADLLDDVYYEVQRRAAIIDEHGEVKLSDLPAPPG